MKKFKSLIFQQIDHLTAKFWYTNIYFYIIDYFILKLSISDAI